SVGVGPTISYLEGTLSSNSIVPILADPTNPLSLQDTQEVLYTAKGDDVAVGANVGVLFQPYNNTTFGLTYKSETRFKLSGDAKLADFPGSTDTIKGNAKLRFTAPESIDLSFTHKF